MNLVYFLKILESHSLKVVAQHLCVVMLMSTCGKNQEGNFISVYLKFKYTDG